MAQRTFLLAPKLCYKPDGTIQLGNIIADPFRPDRPLSALDPQSALGDLRARYPRTETVNDSGRTIALGKGHSVSLAVWARIPQLFGSGGGASGERAKHASATYSADSLETEYFVHDPAEDEIRSRAAAEPRVMATMKGNWRDRARPVYMVGGRVVAKGLAVSSDASSTTSGSVDAEVAVTPNGEISVGASVGGGVSAESRDEWTAEGDRVLAYQLLKIELKGWRKKKLVVNELVPKEAILAEDDEDSEDDDDDDESGADEDLEMLTSAFQVDDVGIDDRAKVFLVEG